MSPKLGSELLCRITGDLPPTAGTLDGVIFKGAVITERVVVWIYLEFNGKVDERYVGYDIGVSTTSRFIERNIWFDFGFVRADALVWMTMRVHKVEAGTVRLQRSDL
jgi:hypothetical protein